MKIVFINYYYWPDISATSQLLTDLAVHFSSTGYDVHVLASNGIYTGEEARLPLKETKYGVKIRRIPLLMTNKRTFLARMANYLFFYLRVVYVAIDLVGKGDLLICKTDPPLLSIPMAAIAALKQAKLVNWLQDIFPEVGIRLGLWGLRGPVGTITRLARNWAWRRASSNVVIGERMARHLAQTGISPSNIVVIPNWTDTASIHPVESANNNLRREWGLENNFVIGYSGNLGRAHDYRTIMTAMELLPCFPFHFLFIGGGSGMATLKRESRSRNSKNLSFKPYQACENLAESLSCCDVHIISLLPEMEGLIVPSKIYGILAAGRPTIFIGDVQGEIALLIKKLNCGLSVSKGDALGLATALRELQDNTTLCMEMGNNARRASETIFSRESSLAAWSGLLRRLSDAQPTNLLF